MAVRWIEGALTRSKSQGSARLILVVLANNADDATGTCYPGIKYISTRAGISERSTQRAIRELEELGEVTISPTPSHLGTNLYTLSLTLVTPDAHVTPRQIDTTPPVKLTPKPSVVTVREKTHTRYTPDFEEWWEGTWKVGSKSVAHESYHKLSAEEAMAMERSTRKWTDYYNSPDVWQKHVSTWLNQRMWESDVPRVRTQTQTTTTKPRTGNKMTPEELVGFIG